MLYVCNKDVEIDEDPQYPKTYLEGERIRQNIYIIDPQEMV